MIFNSIPFAIFFVFFYFLYWLAAARSTKIRNIILLLGSYFFYAWWDWQFLFLLIGVTLVTYISANYISKTINEKSKSIVFALNIIVSIGILVYFKYTNFFISSFINLLDSFGFKTDLSVLQIILPLGISFYLFRAISYILDVKNGKAKACIDLLLFANHIAFFPSLISGPIDRAKTLIPQLEKEIKFDYSQTTDGLRQILWGLFKKIVVADNLAAATLPIFDGYLTMQPNILLLGAFYFSIQLYADFSGYSDMAIGIAKLLGFNITKNFDFPYFSQSVTEFWRKWHISLTSWLTDYIFTPISIHLRDYPKLSLFVGIITTFLISGLWHGANWTFVVWGALHGLYYVPSIIMGTMLSKKKKNKEQTLIQKLSDYKNMLGLFLLIMLTNVFFKAQSIQQAVTYLMRLVSLETFQIPTLYKSQFPAVIILLSIEWSQKNASHGLQNFGFKWPQIVRWLFYFILIALIFVYNNKEQQFIYFQF